MTGVAVLARLAVRRSRWFWLAWIAALALVSPLTALASDQILPPGPQRDQLLAVLSSTGALQALTGPAVSLDGPGGVTVWRAGTMLATLAGLMAVLGVVRTTRGDEEAGRTELVRSGSVGRHAPTAAAVLVALGGGIVLGLLVVLGMVAAGTPVAGSVAYGAGLAGTSAVFVGVGAVASQLAGSARAAKGLGLAVVGTSYLARAVSDGTATSPGTSNLLSWLSPVGWTALAHPYAGERWWVLALPALTTAVLLAGAVILEGRRDHGSGFWTSGPGGRQAGPTLSHPRGLALRLHRAGIAAWAVGVSAWALLMGLLCTGFTEVMGASRELGVMMRRLGAGARDPAEAFVLAQLALIALVVAVCGVQLLTRLRQEETDGRADLVLATRVRRTVLAWSHLGPALLVPSVLLVGAGVLLALPGAVEQADPARVRDLAAAAMALLPGVWLVVGLGFALHGWVPTAFAVVWFVIGWTFFVSWLGAVLDLPRWLIRLTPLGPLPRLPQEPMAWGPVLGVSALTLACLAAGLAGYRRRDLLTG